MILKIKNLAINFKLFLFPELSAFQLGVARFLFYLNLFIYLDLSRYTLWSFVDKQLWLPAGFSFLIPVEFVTQDNLLLLTKILPIALIFSSVGFLTRISTLVSFISAFILLAVSNSFGHFYHNESTVVFTMLIMVVAPCADDFSVDKYIFKKFKQPLNSLYGWPIRLVQITWCWMFFSAGISKLFTSGLLWITADTLSYYLVSNYITRIATLDGSFWAKWGMGLAQNTILCNFLAAGVMAMELSYPLALLKKNLKWFYVSAGVVFQLSVFILMGIKFSIYFSLLPFWVDWDYLKRRYFEKT